MDAPPFTHVFRPKPFFAQKQKAWFTEEAETVSAAYKRLLRKVHARKHPPPMPQWAIDSYDPADRKHWLLRHSTDPQMNCFRLRLPATAPASVNDWKAVEEELINDAPCTISEEMVRGFFDEPMKAHLAACEKFQDARTAFRRLIREHRAMRTKLQVLEHKLDFVTDGPLRRSWAFCDRCARNEKRVLKRGVAYWSETIKRIQRKLDKPQQAITSDYDTDSDDELEAHIQREKKAAANRAESARDALKKQLEAMNRQEPIHEELVMEPSPTARENKPNRKTSTRGRKRNSRGASSSSGSTNASSRASPMITSQSIGTPGGFPQANDSGLGLSDAMDGDLTASMPAPENSPEPLRNSSHNAGRKRSWHGSMQESPVLIVEKEAEAENAKRMSPSPIQEEALQVQLSSSFVPLLHLLVQLAERCVRLAKFHRSCVRLYLFRATVENENARLDDLATALRFMPLSSTPSDCDIVLRVLLSMHQPNQGIERDENETSAEYLIEKFLRNPRLATDISHSAAQGKIVAEHVDLCFSSSNLVERNVQEILPLGHLQFNSRFHS